MAYVSGRSPLFVVTKVLRAIYDLSKPREIEATLKDSPLAVSFISELSNRSWISVSPSDSKSRSVNSATAHPSLPLGRTNDDDATVLFAISVLVSSDVLIIASKVVAGGPED